MRWLTAPLTNLAAALLLTKMSKVWKNGKENNRRKDYLTFYNDKYLLLMSIRICFAVDWTNLKEYVLFYLQDDLLHVLLLL